MYLTYLIILSTWTFGGSSGISVYYLKHLFKGKVDDEKVPADLTKEITALRKEVVALQRRVLILESENTSQKEVLKSSGGEIEGVYDNDHSLRKRAAVRRRFRRIPEVAFQGTLTKESTTFNLDDQIIFNNVITNIGNAYNKHSGFFTAPLAGTYNFNTNIVSGKGHYVEASIQVNDIPTVAAISDHRILENEEYFTRWDQGNAVAILSLNRGDKVSVSIQWPRGSHVIHGFGKSSFSGYLVRSHERQ